MEEAISYTKQQIEENTLILDKEGVLSVCDNNFRKITLSIKH